MTTLLLSLVGPAHACGGLVCEPGPSNTVVVQNAERIAFHIDEDAGTVETHVQVFYEGPPDQFGWVVPVSSAPEVFLSTESLFTQLGTQLAPTVELDTVTEGNCRTGNNSIGGCMAKSSPEFESAIFDTGGFDAGVEVVNEGSVGPYDFAVLAAQESGPLLEWMADNAFAVPDGLEPLLAPYLSENAHFLAVKLSKSADTGDIAPLGWTYEGEAASVPIQLTALAAAPDLRLEVSVFGAHRAVPESYLHVRINEANLDWFSGGTNYYDVVSRAADQAGGHAFATDYAGETDALDGSLWSPDREALAADIALAETGPEIGALLAGMNLALNANLYAALADHTGLESLEQLQIGLNRADFELADPALLARDLELFVFEPLRRAEALFDSRWVTRMSSSLDAAEMTVDPVFVLNEEAGSVSNVHRATVFFECFGKRIRRAPRRLELEDGRVYSLPALDSMATTDSEYWLSQSSDIEAILIEQPSKHAPAEVIVDNTDAAWANADGERVACGCRGFRMPFTGSMLGLLTLGILRRRRS